MNTTTTADRQTAGHQSPKEVIMTHLPSSFVAGARVVRPTIPTVVGTITRVIDAEGALGGLVEVRWDGRRVSRSAGFFSPQEIRVIG